jgi:hypothetical protein
MAPNSKTRRATRGEEATRPEVPTTEAKETQSLGAICLHVSAGPLVCDISAQRLVNADVRITVSSQVALSDNASEVVLQYEQFENLRKSDQQLTRKGKKCIRA